MQNIEINDVNTTDNNEVQNVDEPAINDNRSTTNC